ncbi:Ribosomal protein lysine methyltransferase [Cryptotrichosporon argae]
MSAADAPDLGSAAPLVPPCPTGLFMFTDDCVLVGDVDEEVMELYMALPEESHGGLGYVDGTSSTLEIQFDLARPAAVADEYRPKGRGRRKAKHVEEQEEVCVSVSQDIGALKGRKGDTGSVLWRSTLHLARRLLSDARFGARGILDPAAAARAHVVELGAGIGVLPVLVHALFGGWTATDQPGNLGVIRRNVGGLGPAVRVDALDWLDVATRCRRTCTWRDVDLGFWPAQHDADANGDAGGGKGGLVIAVDCIYNEHLVGPFVDTLAALAGPGVVVWVVAELRSADVITHFLETWTAHPSGPWTLVRLGPRALGDWDGAPARWASWVGWRAA